MNTPTEQSSESVTCPCCKTDYSALDAPVDFKRIKKWLSGLRGTGVYNSFYSMHTRCHNPKCPEWKNYGGRGIKVCERWNSFANFVCDMGFREDGLSIERIDNNGNYEPGNCRWATTAEQTRNQRRSHKIEFNGEVMTVAEWWRKMGLNETTLHSRLSKGWDLERALTTPARRKSPNGTTVRSLKNK